MSKRQELREKRKRQQQMQMLALIVGAALVVVSVGAYIIMQNNKPVGEIVSITPQTNLPNPNGKELGDPNAKVTIEVWEDFQCPACKQFTEDIEPAIIENLVATGKARYIVRLYPFIDGAGITGGESDQAANAAMCAAEQNQFFSYHLSLFANWNGENKGAFVDRRLVAFAKDVGLDMTAFNKCFNSNKYKTEIQNDFDLGLQVGVSGTPSVFVNRVLLTPGYIPSYKDIVAAVEDALNK